MLRIQGNSGFNILCVNQTIIPITTLTKNYPYGIIAGVSDKINFAGVCQRKLIIKETNPNSDKRVHHVIIHPKHVQIL
jgi:hypothetical protein